MGEKQNSNSKTYDLDDLLTLMDIYLSEWQFRDELLWKQTYKFFYATLVVLLLPNITGVIGISLPGFPSVLFPILSLVMSTFFLYTCFGYLKRLEASVKTYANIISKLPKDLQRISISDSSIKHGRFFRRKTSTTICLLMYLCLVAMAITMIVYYIII